MNEIGAYASKDLFIVQLAKSQEDFDFVKRMVTEEGWVSAGAHSIAHIRPIVKPGFFIGYLNGQRIGQVSAIKYGEDRS